mgnify:CR=1 FL=1
MATNRKTYAKQEYLAKREQGFTTSGLQSVRLKEYNALYDPNMRHFFESKHNQNLLYRTGQIDSHGRVIDYEKNKSKLHILEREFKEAERVEEKRQQEEREMRVGCISCLYFPFYFYDILTIVFQFSIGFNERGLMNWNVQRSRKYWRGSKPREI